MSVVALKTERESLCEEAAKTLRDASAMEFVTVVIVGQRFDGTVWYGKSSTSSTLETLGALEHAKHEILEKWK